MDGLEVARRTVHLSPTSKILFVTQENSPQIVKEAFRIGAWAYVLNTDAATELLNAVRSVLRGDKFMSSGCFRS
jgi:DNA-binding NarL/FixJ family response regulator